MVTCHLSCHEREHKAVADERVVFHVEKEPAWGCSITLKPEFYRVACLRFTLDSVSLQRPS